ncbi:MAG: DUF3644 domain-containing protein [Candidatus Binatus sp.]
MPRSRRKVLERWEVSLVKAMLAKHPRCPDQDILAYFTRPTRSINHRAISEIRTGTKHATTRVATDEELSDFLASWPNVDPQTGLNLRGDELLVKAREAMIAAVHTFNGAGLHFRAEIFIVTAIIAWTYLHHAYYRREGIEYRYFDIINGGRTVARTREGAEKYLELGACIRHQRCPLDQNEKNNLEFLIEIRHEIEHRTTSRIDDTISAKLQACCINFNYAIKRLFGDQFGLERRIPIALQFVTFSRDQRGILKKAIDLPAHIQTMMNRFQENLTDEQLSDPRYSFAAIFVQKIAKRRGTADEAIEFLPADSDLGQQINNVYIRDREPTKFKPMQIVNLVKERGFPRFTIADHARLWQDLDAKNPGKGYGTLLSDGAWYWYQRWLDRVIQHCDEAGDSYRIVKRAATPPAVLA